MIKKHKERVLNNIKAKAKQLGYDSALKLLAGSEVSWEVNDAKFDCCRKLKSRRDFF